MFGKKDHLVGLDIGSRAIKVAEVEINKKVRTLKRFGVLDIPPGLIEDGVIRDPEQVADAIRQLFKLQKISTKKVALSIGGYSIFVETRNFPDIPDNELQEKVRAEIEPIIPYDINEVYFDYHRLDMDTGDPDQVNVAVVAAKKEMVNDYVNLVEVAGLSAYIVDIDAFALQNIYEINYEPGKETIALIDIGANKTALNIVKGTGSVFTRDVSMGCQQINLKIVSHAGCTAEEAEMMYTRRNDNDKISSKELGEIIDSVVTEWCTEIRRALDFFYSTYPDEQVGKVVLSGGGANIKKFRELLAIETSTEVEVIKPFENFTIDRGLDASYLEKNGPQAAICMGLAVRRLYDKL